MTLARLIEAVERGTLDLAMMEDHLPTAGDSAKAWDDFIAAFNGSLDAAKRLHDALLPGWRVGQIGQAHSAPDDVPNLWLVWIVAPDYLESTVQAEAESADPARAWLLAVLRAMEGRDQ